MARRVVITGLGAITSLGCDVRSTWEGLLAGRSGVGPITHFDATDFACHIAAEVNDFDPTTVVEAHEVRKFDPFTLFGMGAADQAIADSGVLEGDLDLDLDQHHAPARRV